MFMFINILVDSVAFIASSCVMFMVINIKYLSRDCAHIRMFAEFTTTSAHCPNNVAHKRAILNIFSFIFILSNMFAAS